MNNRVNYTFVGIVVLIGVLLMFGFAYWLLQPSKENETKYYHIYFNESVSGLNVDAPVKYRGISVGKVSKIGINPQNSEEVEVLISVLKSTPVKEDTVAKLTSQGITGLSYINLSLGQNGAPCLRTQEGQKYPVIKTEPSFLERFEKSFGDVSTEVSKTLVQTQELLNKQNQEDFAKLLSSSASLMQKLDATFNEQTIAHLQATAKNLEALSYKADKIMPKVEKFVDNSVEWENKVSTAITSIMVSYLGVRSSMAEIRRAVSSGEFNVKEITSDIIPQVNSTLLDMQQILIKLDEIFNQYDRSPADVLFKQEEIRKGPGEEN